MTLREQIAEDLESVFLNTDDFADSVTFYPKNGTPRTVVMLVDVRRDFRESEPGLVTVEVAECRCLRDPNNASKGGVDNPQIGDGILLSTEADPSQRKFGYVGIATEISASDWVLHFSRDVLFRQGGGQQS